MRGVMDLWSLSFVETRAIYCDYFETESKVDWEPRYNLAPFPDTSIIP